MAEQYGKWVSNNYVAGSMGWMINADGSAEFLNITARGIIYSGNPTGERAELSANKLLFYDPEGEVLMDIGYYVGASFTGIYFGGRCPVRLEGTYLEFIAGGVGIFIVADTFPNGAGNYNLGDAVDYWNDISYKTITDRAGTFKANPDEAYNIIKNIKADKKGKCRKLEDRGLRRIKFSNLPKHIWDDALEETKEDIVFDENTVIDNQVGYENFKKGQIIAKKGEKTRWRITKRKYNDGRKHIVEASEGLEMTGFISYLLGAVQKLQEKVEALENK